MRSTILLLVSIGALAACNSLTGASSLKIGNHGAGDSDGQGGDDGATAGSQSDGATTGAGAGHTTGSGPSGATTGPGSTSGATTGAATGGAVTSAAATSGSGMACQYPAGPYGVAQGDTLPQNLQWQGFAEGSNTAATISIADYLDCDGSRGINALLIDSSAVWCGACQSEAMELPADMQKWAPMGIHVLTLMIEDAQGSPATVAIAQQWKTDYALTTSATVADPGYSVLPMGSVGLPYQIIVDPRTMKVVLTEEGFAGQEPDLEALAKKNGAP